MPFIYKQKTQTLLTGFSSTFWVANGLELFERMAYYGSKAILTIFLAHKVGLDKEAGFLAGLFNAVLYALPVVSGVFVDKYGFKKMLMTCFFIFTLGYFLIALAGIEYGQFLIDLVGKKVYVIIVLIFTAIGGSLIKPCIVGTVTKTTKKDSQALGFSIYYTLVNFGGAIGPIIAYYIRTDLGIEYVLIMSSFTSFLLLVGAFFFYKEPDEYVGEKKTFNNLFNDMILVFTNFKFIIFLFIFSGFWMMFWQIYYCLPFYAKEVLHYDAFEFLVTVDAWVIILVTIPVTALVSRVTPIKAMIIGVALSSISWIIIGAGGTVMAIIIGIVFFALGEAIQSPRFYEYVGLLAPKHLVGTFMGFAFLPIAIGSFIAGVLSDWLRSSYLATNPPMMWYILSGIGLITTILLVVYDYIFLKKKNINLFP